VRRAEDDGKEDGSPYSPEELKQIELEVLDNVALPEELQDGGRLEKVFVFAAVWGMGAAFETINGIDYRTMFSDWWRETYRDVKFPARGLVFEVYLDEESGELEPWSNSPFFETIEFDSSNQSIYEVTVPTPENVSINYWLSMLVDRKVAAMLVGIAGCGKTQLLKGLLGRQDEEKRISCTINMNYFTTTNLLQSSMETVLVKKTGTSFGPPGKADLIYFVDDLNLPEVDQYDTQSAISLLRMVMQYGRWSDRIKLNWKNILNCQYLASMNPTAGSNNVNPRLQLRFVAFAMGFPGAMSLLTIFQTFLDGHLKQGFSEEIQSMCVNIINATLDLHNGVCDNFKKSAINFHYEFNVRHLASVFEGLLSR